MLNLRTIIFLLDKIMKMGFIFETMITNIFLAQLTTGAFYSSPDDNGTQVATATENQDVYIDPPKKESTPLPSIRKCYRQRVGKCRGSVGDVLEILFKAIFQ